ncbi:hypothetical protein ACJX0J_014270 [Zea mays]
MHLIILVFSGHLSWISLIFMLKLISLIFGHHVDIAGTILLNLYQNSLWAGIYNKELDAYKTNKLHIKIYGKFIKMVHRRKVLEVSVDFLLVIACFKRFLLKYPMLYMLMHQKPCHLFKDILRINLTIEKDDLEEYGYSIYMFIILLSHFKGLVIYFFHLLAPFFLADIEFKHFLHYGLQYLTGSLSQSIM